MIKDKFMPMNKIFGAFSIVIVVFLLFAISCKKDSENNTVAATVTDIDGNVYHTLIIGTQVWMVENLKVIKYRNGDLIGTTAPDTLDITGENEPKYHWASSGFEDSVATYGRLYTWYAVTDCRNVCPSGWHVPSDVEWTTTEEYLITNGYNYDGTTTGNNIAKSMADKTNWFLSTNPGSVGNTDYPTYRNKSGFTALPGGYRSSEGTFLNTGISNDWWCSTDSSSNNAWFRNLYYSYSDVFRSNYAKSSGFSVRCLRD
jgi:uncharacterized protein (TIGR02145 family)